MPLLTVSTQNLSPKNAATAPGMMMGFYAGVAGLVYVGIGRLQEAMGLIPAMSFGYLALIVAGLVLGSLFLATDLITNMSQLQEEHLNIQSTDVAFPASIFVYSAAAIFVEVVYRLLTIPLLLALISIVVRSQSAREKMFWVLAFLTSLIEPIINTAASQYSTLFALTFVLVQSFAANFLQAIFFRKCGFLAAILLRVAFYIPFHVIGSFLK